MEISTPLRIGPYGRNVRFAENLYFYIEKEYCLKPFETSNWYIIDSNENVWETILNCCDHCQIPISDEYTAVHHMEVRIQNLYNNILQVYERTGMLKDKKRLEKNCNDITEEDIRTISTSLGVWIIIYNDNQRTWNMDDMTNYLLDPKKVFFLLKKDAYYSMYPKDEKSITKKYKNYISTLPLGNNNFITFNYPKYYREKKFWLKLVKHYFMEPFDIKNWKIHKVPSGPNSLLQCFLLYVKLFNKPLMTSPVETLSEMETIQHYRNVIAHHYELLEENSEAERVKDMNNPLNSIDFHNLTSRSMIWDFVRYENKGIDQKTGFWNYYQRQYCNFIPQGILFLLSVNENEYMLITPRKREERFEELLLSNIEENFVFEQQTKKKQKSKEQTKKKRCPKGTVLDKDTNECVDKKIVQEKKKLEKEKKKLEKEEEKKMKKLEKEEEKKMKKLEKEKKVVPKKQDNKEPKKQDNKEPKKEVKKKTLKDKKMEIREKFGKKQKIHNLKERLNKKRNEKNK
jgi:hypothetical protein